MNWVGEKLKKYFIPHEGNDHRPQRLRRRTVAFVLILAFSVELIYLYGAANLEPQSHLFGLIVANTLVDETNQNRVANGDAALTVSPLLEAAAQDKANDMVANNYFAHTSPSGLSPWYWFERVGYNFTSAGENLAVNFSDSQDVTNAWMNSPEHRANILNGTFTQIGIATATGTYEGNSAVYVVELFGTPASAMSVVEPIALATPTAPIRTTAAPKAQSKPVAPVVTTAGASGASVAVKGAATETEPTVASITLVPAVTSVVPAAQAEITQQPIATLQSNFLQALAANPRNDIDDIYLAIILFFAISLAINVFVKVQIQHREVIWGGMLVILIAGLLIVVNLHATGTTIVL